MMKTLQGRLLRRTDCQPVKLETPPAVGGRADSPSYGAIAFRAKRSQTYPVLIGANLCNLRLPVLFSR